MLKKFLACLLTLALMLSFAACGQTTDIRGEVSSNTNAATQPQETTVPPTEAEFEIGSSTGNTYKNQFIGIQCTLDANWVFKTDEEIRAQNQATLGLVGDEYKDLLANAAIVYDMVAVHTNQMDTVNVVMEKMSVANLLMTEEQYLNLSKDSAVGGLQSMGFTVDKAEVTKIQFAGAEHAALTLEGSFSGIAFYETMVVVKCNGYIACITVGTWIENYCADIINQFQPC